MTDIVNALLVRNGTILLGRRSPERKAYPNRWSFPGGHVEEGESLDAALLREVREEVGVTPVMFRKLGVIEEPNPQANGKATYHMYEVSAWVAANHICSAVNIRDRLVQHRHSERSERLGIAGICGDLPAIAPTVTPVRVPRRARN
jgi:mutator protein MutT